MIDEQNPPARRGPRRTRRDWGRALARLLCVVFGLVGAIPLSGGVVLRSKPVQNWAAAETTRILDEQLGVKATFTTELSFVPLRLAVNGLRVPSTDGGEAAIRVGSIVVSPRFFSLLAGRIDVGDIELENTSLRLVVEEGEVKNLAYRFQKRSEGARPKLTRAPFRSLAISNARLDLSLDGTRIKTEGIDVDAFAEEQLKFDVAIRSDGATIHAQRQLKMEATDNAPPQVRQLYDEDRLCALDLRVLLSMDEVVVRRFSLLGALDLDESPDSSPSCDPKSEGAIAIRLSQLKIQLEQQELSAIRGHVMTRLPLGIADRVVPGIAGTGWTAFSGDLHYTPGAQLPELSGRLSGKGMSLSAYKIADDLRADLLITGGAIIIPEMYAQWGNGESFMEGIKIEPFKEKMPLKIDKIATKKIDFPGVVRDIDVTAHSWVEWNFGTTTLQNVGGTISPFYIDGGVESDTRDFVIWDRGFDDPARVKMLEIPRAQVKGRFRAHARALEFYNTNLLFGASSMPVDLVSIPISDGPLIVRLKEGGGALDLADLSPIAGVDFAGKSKIMADLKGPPAHPVLSGSLAVQDLVIGGFPVGNIHESQVRFEPLFVELTTLRGQKGEMDYVVPKARLSFDGPASVELTAQLDSESFDVEEFFKVFQLDEDPRFDGIEAQGAVKGEVRYLLGGPEDTCGTGRVWVQGSSNLKSAVLAGERFGEGNAQFEFEWFDMAAGAQGMRVNVPSMSLSKATGSIFGSVNMYPGGLLSGDFVGTRIPVSHLDTLGGTLGRADGYVTFMGQVRGTVDALSFSADLDVTALEAGDARLGPSSLDIQLVAEAPQGGSSEEPRGACGRRIADTEVPANDDEDDVLYGLYKVRGDLFGGQVHFDDLNLTRQTNMVLRGNASLKKLNIGALSQIFAGGTLGDFLPSGSVSGDVKISEYFLNRPFDSKARVNLKRADLEINGLSLRSEDSSAALVIADRKIQAEALSLRATTERGEDGVIDVTLSIDDQKQLDASFDLRPTNLDVLAAAMPGIEEASGRLSASLGLKGPLQSPRMFGFVEVEGGQLLLSDLNSPVSDLRLSVALDQAGLRVTEGSAQWGGGAVEIGGSAPLVAGQLGRTNLSISARSVDLPIEEDVGVTFDADLKLAIPAPRTNQEELPTLSGSVNVLSASYEKPMNITADITTLTARGAKTAVEGYDETKNNLRLDLLIRSNKPLKVENELVTASLTIDPAGLRITGTDQRFGAVGTVALRPGGQVFLRRNEFEITQGLVRFNDPTHLKPEVDMSAVTEYRRYEDRGATEGQTQSTDTGSSASKAAGNWRIHLRAYGSPDDLKVDLNSDPPLAQDDIFLLLTVGLTRTELDQTRNSGVGSSVALEALGSLSGAESAVTDVVPVDEFRFGSSYSSRSGRTEPTVTIGKRLSRRIRASVTTSLSDTSEVRSNVEYRATDSLSVEGSFDNAGDVATATGGNLGGDVRWRLEFQ